MAAEYGKLKATGEALEPPDQHWCEDVAEFHRQFGLLIKANPGWPDETTIQLRKGLIREEAAELEVALLAHDIEGTADAIVDLIYVLVGSALSFGIDLREVWDEVQRANMAKVGGSIRADGKILKPVGWEPPDIAGALRRGRTC